jgi:tetratricopeptide (TPR) repeat protein
VRYRAFISYSHSDEAFAARLHRDLERYRLPARVVQAKSLLSNRLGVIFRDRDELASSASLSDTIRDALQESECLIVVCSPQAASSQWVGAEIEAFRQLQPEAPILPIIPDSLTDAATKVLFPPALSADDEPLAADARVTGDGPKRARLKLIAGLIGVRFDDLVEREAVRARQRLMAASALTITMVGAAALLVDQTRRAEQEADEQRAQAAALVDYLVTDLTTRLQEYEQVGELDQGLSQALNYFGALPAEALDDDTLQKYRGALIGVGSVRIRQGKLEEALASFLRAMEISEVAANRSVQDASEWYELAQNTYYVGEAYWEMQNISVAAEYITQSLDYSKMAAALEPDTIRYRIEVVFGLNNIGAVNTRLKRYEAAMASLHASMAEIEQLRAQFPSYEEDLLVQEVESVSWLAEILPTLGRFEEGFAWHEREISLREGLYQRTNNIHHLARLSDALGYYARTLIAVGRTAEARSALERTVDISTTLGREDPGNVFWRTRGYLGRVMLARELHHDGDTAAGLAELDAAEAGLQDLLAEGRNTDLVRLHLAFVTACRAYFSLPEPEQALRYLTAAFEALEPTGADELGPVHFAYYMQAVLIESAALDLLGRSPSARVATALALMDSQGEPDASIQDRMINALLQQANGGEMMAKTPRAEFYRRIFETLS